MQYTGMCYQVQDKTMPSKDPCHAGASTLTVPSNGVRERTGLALACYVATPCLCCTDRPTSQARHPPDGPLTAHKYVYASRVHRGSAVHGSEACRQRRQWRRQAHASSSTMQLMECPAAHAWPCNRASYECCRLTSQLASKLLGITPLNASETEGPRLGSLFSGTERVEGCTYLYVHGPP